MAEYDFKSKLAEIAPELQRFQELNDARFKIEIIEAQYAELQKELASANTRIQSLRERFTEAKLQAKSYAVMMELVKTEPTLQEQFDTLLTTMKLMFPDIEERMEINSGDLYLP
jgi:chromosome segregation ATPase